MRSNETKKIFGGEGMRLFSLYAKRTVLALGAAAALFALNGCGDTDVYVDPAPEEVTLFLIDTMGHGVDHIPYRCVDAYDEVVVDDMTYGDGSFTFVVGDRCTFDLFGLPGDEAVPLFIADIDGIGKEDIPYACDNGAAFTDGVTDLEGWFAYPVDAYCKFYF